MHCPDCQYLPALCICRLQPKVTTKPSILILQHPREKKAPLSTGRLTAHVLDQARLINGMSWRSLRHASKDPTAVSSEWGVLFVGTQKNPQKQEVPLEPLKGIIVLDGTWAESKTLWWRNPWLLKCRRIQLFPSHTAKYHYLRREPRPGCLSTYEAVLHLLKQSGGISPEGSNLLESYLDQFLERAISFSSSLKAQ
jgi:DTW domain-containing protein